MHLDSLVIKSVKGSIQPIKNVNIFLVFFLSFSHILLLYMVILQYKWSEILTNIL